MASGFTSEELSRRINCFTNNISNDLQVIAIYLFGSYALGRQTHLSDVDIAVLLDKSVKKEFFLEKRLSLMAELSIALGSDNFDLIILNEVPPVLAYRVFRDGQLLFLRDGVKDQYVNFKARTLDRHFDYQPVREYFSQVLFRRLEEGNFGG